MKVSDKLFKEIIKNLNQTEFTVFSEDNFDIVFQSIIKCYTIEIYVNQEYDKYISINGNERHFDLTEEQLKEFDSKLTNEIDLSFQEYERLETRRIKEERENTNDIDYLGYTN